MKKKLFIAMITFMQGINPLQMKSGKKHPDGTPIMVGKPPRKASPKSMIKGFFIHNPLPFTLAELEPLVEAVNDEWIIRETPAQVKDNKSYPPMLWVGQDFPQDTVDDLFDIASDID